MEKKVCSCGCEMVECFFSQGILPLQPQISVNDGINCSVSIVNTYVCTSCGKIEFYTDASYLTSGKDNAK